MGQDEDPRQGSAAADEEAVLTEPELSPEDDEFGRQAGRDSDAIPHSEVAEPLVDSSSDDDQGVTSWADHAPDHDWGTTSTPTPDQSLKRESGGRKRYPRRNRRPPKYFY